MNLILGSKKLLNIFKDSTDVVISEYVYDTNWVRVDPSDASSIAQACQRIADFGNQFDTLYILPPEHVSFVNLSSSYDYFDISREFQQKFAFPAVLATVILGVFQLKQTVLCVSSKFNTPAHKMQRQFVADFLKSGNLEFTTDIFD